MAIRDTLRKAINDARDLITLTFDNSTDSLDLQFEAAPSSFAHASEFTGRVLREGVDVTEQIIKRNVTPIKDDARAIISDASRAARASGRVSVESQTDIRFSSGVSDFIQVNTDQDSKDIFDYSEKYVRSMKPSKLLEMLCDASPEMSRAFFDFLMMCCPGWSIRALNEDGDIDQTADAYLDECVDKLRRTYKAPEIVFVKLFMSAWLRGAVCSEIVLDKRGTDFVDISPIDPDSLEHHRIRDKVRGLVWQIAQRQGNKIIPLDIPQVAYIPIHPFFGTNKGRPLARPAIFACFFLIAVLQDLRRVIRQQGYPRMDISVSIEKLKKMIPSAQANNMDALKTLAESIVNEVKTIYRSLKPDDTFIHTEVVEVNQPIGTLNASSLGVVGELLQCLERMATRALKTMPLMMATTDGVSEANANRQWEIHVAGIKSMQHYVESVLEDHFNLALRAKGLQARCEFRFAELRAAELLRDAQVETLMTLVARAQYDNGSISADEMASKSAGKDQADVPEPRVAQGAPPSDNPQNINADPGSNRKMMETFARLTLEEMSDAKKIFETFAPAKAKGLLEATVEEVAK